MKSVIAWLAVNAFLVAVCVCFAAVFLGLFKIGNWLVPALMDEPLFVFPLGLLALGLTLALIIGGSRALGRVRARGW